MSLLKFLFRRRRKRQRDPVPSYETQKQFHDRLSRLYLMALLMKRP